MQKMFIVRIVITHTVKRIVHLFGGIFDQIINVFAVRIVVLHDIEKWVLIFLSRS